MEMPLLSNLNFIILEIFRQVTANNLIIKEYPFWKELAMEAYLLENEEILKLDKSNFSDVEILDAEIALKEGRRGGDGRIDILVKYSGEYLGIVEIKLHQINEDSLEQLQDYLLQKQRILANGKDYWQESAPPKWVGVLVGLDISSSLRDKLSNGYEFNGIPIAGMTIRRFRNENEILVISDTYFKYKYSSKDYSKFLYNGLEYNKGRLVNAVVKHYVEERSPVTFAELKNDFPDHLQGSFGVFETKEKAVDIYQRWGHKRHYINADEQIKLEDQIICTCNQWNPENIKAFLNQANSLGQKIEVK